jgi:hypothetical protein
MLVNGTTVDEPSCLPRFLGGDVTGFQKNRPGYQGGCLFQYLFYPVCTRFIVDKGSVLFRI